MRLITIFLLLTFLYSCSTLDVNEQKSIGIRQYENDSLTEAIVTLSRTISFTDTCSECFLYRGFAYKALKQYDKALQDFDSFIKIDTNEALGYANRASVYYLQNNYKSSLQDYMRAHQLDTNAKVFFNPICHMLFATGQKDEACFYYKKSIEVGDTTFDNSIKVYCEETKIN
jgi:tetratricopeptide (TPR) repeat protein